MQEEIEKANYYLQILEKMELDSKITSLIKEKKGSYFLYEEITNNINLLNEQVILLPEENLDKNAKIIREINEDFIVDCIQTELEDYLQSNHNVESTGGEFKNRLNKMINETNNVMENEKDGDKINSIIISNLTELLEILFQMDKLVNERLKKKCKKCNNS